MQNSNTALMFAAYGNHPHALNELLNHSADLTLTNLNDDTALSIAMKRSCKEGSPYGVFSNNISLLDNILSYLITAQSVIEGYLFMLLQPS